MSSPSLIPPEGRPLTPDEYNALVDDMAVIIAQSHLFKSLDDRGRRDVLESGYVCAFAENATIMRQSDPGDTMYLIMNGTVRVTTIAHATEYDLATLGRGACIGEVAVLTGNARTATVVAQTPVDLVAFRKHRIDKVLDAHPKVREVLQALVEGRAEDAVSKIVGP